VSGIALCIAVSHFEFLKRNFWDQSYSEVGTETNESFIWRLASGRRRVNAAVRLQYKKSARLDDGGGWTDHICDVAVVRQPAAGMVAVDDGGRSNKRQAVRGQAVRRRRREAGSSERRSRTDITTRTRHKSTLTKSIRHGPPTIILVLQLHALTTLVDKRAIFEDFTRLRQPTATAYVNQREPTYDYVLAIILVLEASRQSTRTAMSTSSGQ